MSFPQLIIGLFSGSVIGYLAWRAKALSRSGGWAAAVTGGLIFGLGGFPWGFLLMTFFISSSALSRAFSRRKAVLSEKFAKGSQRDWGQVLANGGVGTILVLAHTILRGEIWPWVAFGGAMAAVNADTWATELGVLSPNPPRLITSGKVVERGASGGVTLLGTLATVGGGALVALFAGISSPQPGLSASLIAITFAGLVGSLLDSILGATIQGIYRCPQCDKETERHPVHLCGSETTLIRGWRWLNNDLVNFIASVSGALTALGVWSLIV
jgi:uncharacterized protein (TIGR00297 family)